MESMARRGNKDPKPKKADPVDPTVAKKEAKRKELAAQAAKLQEQVQEETLETYRFQLQKQKLQNYWAVEKKRLADLKVEVAAKDHEIEECDDLQVCPHLLVCKTCHLRSPSLQLNLRLFEPPTN